MDAQENLQLSVANFGPIAKAEIDLRPLTVFVGPSNTGKSYLAILIYALHKFFGGRQITPLRYRYVNRTIFDRRYGLEDPTISPEEFEILRDWIEPTLLGSSQAPRKSTILPESVSDIVRPLLKAIDSSTDVYNSTLAREFGVEEIRNLIRNRSASGAQIAIRLPVSDTAVEYPYFEYEFIMRNTKSEIHSVIPETLPLHLTKENSDSFYRSIRRSIRPPITQLRSEEDDTQYLMRSILNRLTEVVGSSIVSPLTRASYYLPADRTGVMHAHRVVVRSIIAQAPRAGLQHDTALPQLSGVLADFLEQLIGLEDRPIRNPNGNLAAQIERDILEGEVILERSEVGYPEFLYRPRGWKHDDLRLMNTSSMVSELAPVVLYLRHVVRPGDVLIIEEPESHLHPKMQVEFTRYLAAAVNAGIRVMITTHSEWVMDELANLVYSSHLPKSKRDGISGAEFALKPSQVGAWLFESKKVPKGSVVKEITFSTEYGGFETRFEDVAIGTHNSYATIANRLAGLLPA